MTKAPAPYRPLHKRGTFPGHTLAFRSAKDKDDARRQLEAMPRVKTVREIGLGSFYRHLVGEDAKGNAWACACPNVHRTHWVIEYWRKARYV